MYQETLHVEKSLYPPESVLKAAYAFLDVCYIHIEDAGENWAVMFEPKKNSPPQKEFKQMFENELISQAVRLHVYQQTHAIREILLARAMSSAMILETDADQQATPEEKDIPEDELKSILTSWFDKHE